MVTTRNRITDVFTICARAWPRWTEHIDDYKGLHVSQMLGLYLQNIDIKTPEFTLIHEFTHSESLFAQWVMGKTTFLFYIQNCSRDARIRQKIGNLC